MSLTNSTDELVLIHNPRCSKSRATKALLEERGVTFRERLYLDQPLDADELRALAKRLGSGPSTWIRTGEAAFAEQGLDLGASEDVLFQAVAGEPKLLQRPILIRGDRAIIGRPPEDVLALLDN